DLLLGADGERQAAFRTDGQVGMRFDVRRLQSRVLSDAYLRPARDAASRVDLLRYPRMGYLESALHGRRIRARPRILYCLARSAPALASRRQGEHEPMECGNAGMAADGQLCRAEHSADHEPRAA